jgi:hypothetical protein
MHLHPHVDRHAAKKTPALKKIAVEDAYNDHNYWKMPLPPIDI